MGVKAMCYSLREPYLANEELGSPMHSIWSLEPPLSKQYGI